MAQELSQELQGVPIGDLKNLTERLKALNHPSRDEERRSETIQEALKLWQTYAETYRTAIIKYKFLANERRKANITPLLTVSEKILKEYPSIRLFRCLDETSAREYLDSLDLMSLIIETRMISESVQFNYAYRTVVNKVIEFSYRQKNPKSSYCQSELTDKWRNRNKKQSCK